VRLFTGIALPEDVTERLSALVERLRPSARIGWSRAANLHITTKFIGQWPEDRLPDLIESLRPVAVRLPVDISVEGLGWLPNARSPRVLFADIKAGQGLTETAEATDAATSGLGIPRENRPFRPHLTLARIRDASVPLGPLREAIESIDDPRWGRFRAGSFSLYLSKPGPSGSIYTQLAEFPFSA
jgi:2'-5' RNA ligase